MSYEYSEDNFVEIPTMECLDVDAKSDSVFQHIFTNYYGDRSSIYQKTG